MFPILVFSILAGKSYYFGVGGGMKQFLDLVEKDRTLCYENLWESAEGIDLVGFELYYF